MTDVEVDGGTTSRPDGASEFRSTGELGFAGYLLLHGLKVDSWRQTERNKFVFTFHDPEHMFDDLNVRWTNSDEKRFDDSVRGLKKMTSRNSSVASGGRFAR